MVVAAVLDMNPLRDRVADAIALVRVLERQLVERRLLELRPEIREREARYYASWLAEHERAHWKQIGRIIDALGVLGA